MHRVFFGLIALLLFAGFSKVSAQIIEVVDARAVLSSDNLLNVTERFSLDSSTVLDSPAVRESSKKKSEDIDAREFRRVFQVASLKRDDGTDTPIEFKAVRRNGAPVQFRLERDNQLIALVVSPRAIAFANKPVELEIQYSIETPAQLGKSIDHLFTPLIPQVMGYPIRHLSGNLGLPRSVPVAEVKAAVAESNSSNALMARDWQVDVFPGPSIEYRSRAGGVNRANPGVLDNELRLKVEFTSGHLAQPSSILTRIAGKSVEHKQIGYWFLITSILGQVVFYFVMVRRTNSSGFRNKIKPTDLKEWSAEEVASALGRDERQIVQAGLVQKLVSGKVLLVRGEQGQPFLWSEKSREPGPLWSYCVQLLKSTASRPQASVPMGEAIGLDQLGHLLKSSAQSSLSSGLVTRPPILIHAEKIRSSLDNKAIHNLAIVMALVQVLGLLLLRSGTELVSHLSSMHVYGFCAVTALMLGVFFWFVPRELPFLPAASAILDYRQFIKSVTFNFSSVQEAEEQTKRFEYFLPFAVAMGVQEYLCTSFYKALSRVGASYFPFWYLHEATGEPVDFFNDGNGFASLVGEEGR